MITPNDIRSKQFADAKHGYDKNEIDDYLDEIATQLDALQAEKEQLTAQLREAQEALQTQSAQPQISANAEAEYLNNLQATLRETLLSAQRKADEITTAASEQAAKTVASAQEQAEQTLTAAEEKANALVSAATAEADAAKTDADALREATQEYRARFLRLVEDQLGVLKADISLFE